MLWRICFGAKKKLSARVELKWNQISRPIEKKLVLMFKNRFAGKQYRQYHSGGINVLPES